MILTPPKLLHSVVHENSWMWTHATCPTPIKLGDILRVYYQTRDKDNRGRVAYVDLIHDGELTLVKKSNHVVFDIGRPGCFDDNGVMLTSVICLGDGRLAGYYVGFELSKTVRYRLLSGACISSDGGETFNRLSEVPLLERIDNETHTRGGPFVLKSGLGYSMYYVSGNSWRNVNGKSMPIYDIRSLKSTDPFKWYGEGQQVLSPAGPNEYGLGRPYVLKLRNGFGMHVSKRLSDPMRYRAAYAFSKNNDTWERQDSNVSEINKHFNFDQSIEYVSEIFFENNKYYFYNTHDFGRTGIFYQRVVNDNS